MSGPAPVHATVVACLTPEGWRGVAILGRPGAGKSDLALRLCEAGWRLVGDDYVQLWRSGDAVFAAPAEALAGRIEARGVGILATPHRAPVRLALVIEAAAADAVERLPEPRWRRVDGVAVPLLRLTLTEPSAVAKVAAALRAV